MASNSLLTKTYRELLKNEPVTGQKARQDRLRMRKRVTQGLKDISLLNQYARADDIERIFNRDESDKRSDPNTYEPDQRKKLLKSHWVHAMHMVSLLWHGLRLKGMEKEDLFEGVVCRGIARGEAKYKEVDTGDVQTDISFNTLEVHPKEVDPLERWKRGLGLTNKDLQELHSQLSEHPEVDSIVGEDMGALIDEYLVSENENND